MGSVGSVGGVGSVGSVGGVGGKILSTQLPVPNTQSPIPNHTNIFKEIGFLVQQFGISEKLDKE